MRRIPVSIPIQSDQIDEPNETFRAVLSQEPATSTVTLRPAAATVTITDDDGKIRISTPHSHVKSYWSVILVRSLNNCNPTSPPRV